jgi:hypothetical protein
MGHQDIVGVLVGSLDSKILFEFMTMFYYGLCLSMLDVVLSLVWNFVQ